MLQFKEILHLQGEINGQYGLVPSNFVEKVVEAENPRITSSTASNASLTKVKNIVFRVK